MNDALGHPITAGCTVITSYYHSPSMNLVMKVKRVTKTRVILDIDKSYYRWDAVNRKTVKVEKFGEVRRWPYQVLVIDKQLKYNRKTYPEHMV